MWIVGVRYNKDAVDPPGEAVKADIADLNIRNVRNVRTIRTYMVDGNVSEAEIKKACMELLSDNLVQNYAFSQDAGKLADASGWVVEVKNKPGVTDAVGDSALNGMRVLGVAGVKSVKSGMMYLIDADLSEKEIETICRKSLANPVIQEYTYKKLR